MLFQKTWKHKFTGTEGDCIVFGVNIFAYTWKNTGEKATVIDSIYHQKHIFDIYTVEISGNIKTFAAGEFSNGVWGFYTKQF